MKNLSVMAFVLAIGIAISIAGCGGKNKKSTTPTSGSNATEMKTDGDKPAGADTAQKPDDTANGGADPCAGPSK